MAIIDNPFLLIFMATTGVFLFMMVYFLLFWVQPARTSPARHIIKAKRKKKPVCLLDNGASWVMVTAEREEDGFLVDNFGIPIFTTPNSLKYCEGVRIGVGENNRSILVNPHIVKFLKACKEEKLTARQIRELIRSLEDTLYPKKEGDYGQTKPLQ